MIYAKPNVKYKQVLRCPSSPAICYMQAHKYRYMNDDDVDENMQLLRLNAYLLHAPKMPGAILGEDKKKLSYPEGNRERYP